MRLLKLAPLLFALAAVTPAFGQAFTGPATITQPTTPGDCVKVDTNSQSPNNLLDTGAPCGGGGGSGTVTSVATGTGLTGGPITTTGTISLKPAAAGEIGGVNSSAAVTHSFLTAISTLGVISKAQPACADISDAGTGCSGAASAVGANPTATIGAAAVNGTATTFMRSDAAPPLPATLPALNGSLLTALNGTNITAGSVANVALTNPATTVNGTTCTLGASCTAPAAAGTLTGGTLASGVTASSLTSVGTLTGGATGAGFTVALGTSTITGTIPAANTAALTGDVTKAAGSNVTTLASIPAISGANLTAVPAGVLTGTVADARLSANVPLLNAANTFTAANTVAGPSLGAASTASALTVTSTWNDAATTFKGALLVNVTNTASNVASLLADFQVGGASQANISRSGVFGLLGAINAGGNITAGATSNFAWSGRSLMSAPVAASVQLGGPDVDTGPVAQTLRTQGTLAGGTSNVAGAPFTVIVSPGKGTGAGGSFIVQTTPAGSTGTTVNAPITALTIDSNQAVTLAGTLTAAAANFVSNSVSINSVGTIGSNSSVFAWTSAASTGTRDTTLCRQAAGVVEIGSSTGCAASGSLLLAAATLSGTLTASAGHVEAPRVVTAAGAVTMATTDYVVVVNKTVGAATTVNLPSNPTTGQHYYIKDGKGDAATNSITVMPAAGNIDGAGTLVMNVNYMAIELTYNGTQWNVI